MTPTAAKADKPETRLEEGVETPPTSVSYEEALVKGVWPLLGLAPMDETDHTVEGVA